MRENVEKNVIFFVFVEKFEAFSVKLAFLVKK